MAHNENDKKTAQWLRNLVAAGMGHRAEELTRMAVRIARSAIRARTDVFDPEKRARKDGSFSTASRRSAMARWSPGGNSRPVAPSFTGGRGLKQDQCC